MRHGPSIDPCSTLYVIPGGEALSESMKTNKQEKDEMEKMKIVPALLIIGMIIPHTF